MLSAFTACPLVELKPRDKSKIESFLAYGDRLLVGLNNGTLRIYRVNQAPEDQLPQGDEPSNGSHTQNGTAENHGDPDATKTVASKVRPTDLLREQEKFARYKIEQLAIIREANILIALSGGYVSIYDMHTYELQEQLSRTKGATAFAVTSNIVKDHSTGVPSIVSRLAVAVKRKVLIWSWHDMELEEKTSEITLVSGIKTLTWATGTKLVAGLSSNYVMVDVMSSEVKELAGPGSIGGTPGQETSRLGGVGVASMSYIGMGGTVPKPLATRLGEGQMLLAKDVNTHFIDTDGNSLGRRQIPWNAAPEAVGYSYPYLLALQEPSKGTLEVRNPETQTLLQSISLPSASLMQIAQPNISLAHAGKGFLVGSERVIWRMSVLDYDSQIDALVEGEHLNEAISLLEMLEDALLKDKSGRIRQVKLRKAQYLFEQKKYRGSLDLFTEVSAPPELVIKLYPSIIAGDLSAVPEEQDGPEDGSDSDTRAVNGSPTMTNSESDADEKARSKDALSTSLAKSLLKNVTDEASDSGSIRSKRPDTGSVDGKSQDKDLKAAVRELQGFLADVRRRFQRFLHPDGTLKVSVDELDYENDDATRSVFSLLDIPKDNLEMFFEKLRETARLVDTTLFRAHMFATPSLVGSLFRIANFCDPDVVMEKLEESGRYNDLIDFLFGKKIHRPALELLRKFGQAEEEDVNAPQLHGPQRTITYLQNLPPDMIDLILEFAEWPLRVDVDLGMEVFLADTENAETLPRRPVVEFLEKIDVKLATRYLEHVINELNDLDPDLHEKLLMLYLEQLRQGPREQEREERDEDWEASQEKFLDLLKDSDQYSPAKMLDRLPREDPRFYEARAITFSKMGQHRQALEIYVFKLKNPEKAEEYCNHVHLVEGTAAIERAPSRRVAPTEPEDAQPSIYHTLLSLYLTPPHGYEPQYEPAIELLARHGSRLPANSTLNLIPQSMLVRHLEFYFRGRIRAANSIANEGRVVAGLQKVQNIATQSQLLLGEGLPTDNRGRNRCVTVSEEKVCSVCHKRLGASVISVFPNNTVVHLGCANRKGGIA